MGNYTGIWRWGKEKKREKGKEEKEHGQTF